MDEKKAFRFEMTPIRNRSSRRSIYATLLLVAAGLYFFSSDIQSFFLSGAAAPSRLFPKPAADLKGSDAHSKSALVPLEAHIMSKCPDARVRHPMESVCRVGKRLHRYLSIYIFAQGPNLARRTAFGTWCSRRCSRSPTR